MLLCCLSAQAQNPQQAQQLYREAEKLEKRLLLPAALSKYQQVFEQKDHFWSRRAAFRMGSLIQDIHFSTGRSDSVRNLVVSLYKNLLYDIPSFEYDPELWVELRRQMRWARFGLSCPPMLF